MKATKTVTCTSLHVGGSVKTLTEYGLQCTQRRPNQTTELLSGGHCFAKNNASSRMESALSGVHKWWHINPIC
jgi:hypothetical protein